MANESTESIGEDLRQRVCGEYQGVHARDMERGNVSVDADRRNAIARQKILDKALIFAAKLRKHDHAKEVESAWVEFVSAVDELVGAK